MRDVSNLYVENYHKGDPQVVEVLQLHTSISFNIFCLFVCNWGSPIELRQAPDKEAKSSQQHRTLVCQANHTTAIQEDIELLDIQNWTKLLFHRHLASQSNHTVNELNVDTVSLWNTVIRPPDLLCLCLDYRAFNRSQLFFEKKYRYYGLSVGLCLKE
jgi:hypothetical protein